MTGIPIYLLFVSVLYLAAVYGSGWCCLSHCFLSADLSNVMSSLIKISNVNFKCDDVSHDTVFITTEP